MIQQTSIADLKRTFFCLAVFCVTLFFQAQAEAKNTPGLRCASYSSSFLLKNVGYCLHRSRPDLVSKKSEPVVYFFHGINGSAKSWTDNGYSESLDILSREENFPAFTVVSFDTSDLSFFSDAQGKKTGGEAYESWLLKEFIPFIESRTNVCSMAHCRFAAGISMGGLGALKTALRHPDVFSAAAANSPALAPFNAHNPLIDWLYFFKRHPIGPVQGQALLSRVKKILSTPELFDENDPSVLAARFTTGSKEFPALYFDCGGKDYFGFQEGFFRLEETLKRESLPYTSHFSPEGTHDMFWDRRWWLLRWLRDQVLKTSAEPSSSKQREMK